MKKLLTPAITLALLASLTMGAKCDNPVVQQSAPPTYSATPTGTNTSPAVTVPDLSALPLGQWSIQTNGATYIVRPAITDTINTARGLTPLIPPPYGNVVDAGLGVTVALLTWFARKKSNQADTAEDSANLHQSINTAIIAGVEAANHAPTKVAIQNAAAGAGVQPELHALVGQVTGDGVGITTRGPAGS